MADNRDQFDDVDDPYADHDLPDVRDEAEMELEPTPEKRKLVPLIIAGAVSVVLLVAVGLIVKNSFFPDTAPKSQMPFGDLPQAGAQQQLPPVQQQAAMPMFPANPQATAQKDEPSATTSLASAPNTAASAPMQTSAPAADATAAGTRLQAEALAEINEQLTGLQTRVAALESAASNSKAKQRPPAASGAASVVREPKAAAVKRPAPTADGAGLSDFSIKAVIPGQAWVTQRSGVVHVVQVGDALPGGGVVKEIDPDKGRVVTTAGVVQ